MGKQYTGRLLINLSLGIVFFACLLSVCILSACGENGEAGNGGIAEPAAGKPLADTIHVSEPFRKSPLQDQASWAIQGTRILRNGQRFFPLGIYYTSHHPHQKQRRLEDLPTLVELGCNMLHTPIDHADGELLDAAARHGLFVVLEPNGEAADLILKFSKHPALAWIGTFDDVDQGKPPQYRYPPQQVQEQSLALKRLAPNVLTYISAGYPKRSPDFIGRADVLAQQGYPVPVEPLSSYTLQYFLPPTLASEKAGRGLIHNVQTFGWKGTHRLPTARELENMQFQALALNAQGIFYYTFFDPVTDLRQAPELRDQLLRFHRQFELFEPYLLNGHYERLTAGLPHEHFAALWKKDDQALLLVVNSSQSTAKATAPNYLPKLLEQQEIKGGFRRREHIFGSPEDIIPSQGVAVYRFSR